MKLAMARAMLQKADILLLDEVYICICIHINVYIYLYLSNLVYFIFVKIFLAGSKGERKLSSNQ
jgi:ABC-type branched-subunit amino acid transport system ATPase component